MPKWAGNLLLLCGASIITIVFLELVLRSFYPSHGTWRIHRIPDPELGWVLEPGVEFSRQVPGGNVSVRYNREGFRDSEHTAPLKGNAERIVILGDSFMEANMVPLRGVFHKQLEQIATSRGTQIVTYNLGVGGYGTLQEYMTFNKAGAKRKPNLVLLAFYIHNDVRNNAEYLNAGARAMREGKRKRPYLKQSSGTDWTILKPDYDAIRAKFLKQKNSWSFRIKYNSVLLSLIRNARRAFKSQSQTVRGLGSLSMHMCERAQHYERAWRTTERILKRLRDEVQAAGARFAVFSVPTIFDTDKNLIAELELLANKSNQKLCVENSPGYDRLRTILERNEITYIDLVPDFRKAVSEEGRNLFVKGDWHWNSEGHALAARTVYGRLVSEGNLSR